MSTFSAPSKVFLLGEYAVLAQYPALVACLPPRFSFSEGAATDRVGEAFSPQSPAGKLIRRAGWVQDMQLSDPHAGRGGFGASTAQFALAYRALARRLGWQSEWLAAWDLYRELLKDEPIVPSGADLAAQWSGGVVLYEPDWGTVTDLWEALDWSRLVVFSAAVARKVATHEHLRELAGRGFPDGMPEALAMLDRPVTEGIAAVREGDAARFGRALTDYALSLSEVGLEHPEARADREAMVGLPGVVGLKGSGALLADALIVWLTPDCEGRKRAEVIRVAAERGLVLVADGIHAREAGVKEEA